MTISDLSHKQRIALVALMEAVAMADGSVTEGESSRIGAVAEALGDDEYRRLLNEADERFEDLDHLKQFLETIADRNARELIFGTIWEEAVADPTIVHRESELLQWLSGAWGVDTET